MAQTRIISVVGKKNCGKTTLVVTLAREFTRKGRRVATIKHGTHAADIDREGTDTWRHLHEGMAERVLIDGPGGRAFFQRTSEEGNPFELAQHFMGGTDLVIVEGYTRYPLPKIEVFRSELHAEPHYTATHPHAAHWVAMLSDTTKLKTPFPIFRFNDTAWLMAITSLAWARAIVIDDT